VAAFCTVEDLAAYLQIAIADTNVSAVAAIVAASAAIQDHCGQRLDYVATDVYTFPPVEPGRRTILLPEQPVTAVASVVEDGTTLTVGTHYRWTRAGLLTRVGRDWATGWQDVVVTYSHGYVVIPAAIRSVCIQAAARAYRAGLASAATGGVPGIQSEQAEGDYAVTFAAQAAAHGAYAPPLLAPSEKELLSRYRMPV
jgi:hypothetical protein